MPRKEGPPVVCSLLFGVLCTGSINYSLSCATRLICRILVITAIPGFSATWLKRPKIAVSAFLRGTISRGTFCGSLAPGQLLTCFQSAIDQSGYCDNNAEALLYPP